MELRVLRYFLAICREKNISKAAESLHIAQPSLSKQLKDLEEELGVTLVKRGHRQITLTQEGHYLRERAEEMVSIADKTTYNLQSTNIISGELYIGAGESLAMTRIMKIVDSIIQDNSEVKINFYSGNADEIESRIDNGTLDFGVVMGDRKTENFESLILPERNEFGVIMPIDSELASKNKINPDDLVGKPLIVSNQSMVQDKFRNWWGKNYDNISVVASTNLAYNVSLLAKLHHTYLITYDGLINTDEDSGLVFKPLSPKITDPNTVIWKPNSQLSNIAQLFIDKLQNSLD
ncbi:LysR family transcriptional regulator [Companilactobacillus hulinensis]|uniref:LysR family transcriptional regulator n=1 Tax=Companilactobacillus hulinensis TaxID=2486007 RepID=UPI000F7807E7|nr:LysR family transcriptional regulator [Companilactobacillus hulinensis]